MIRNKDLVVFSDDWGRHPFSCQHIMRHFLKWNKILWVNTIGLRNPQLSPYDLARSIQKVGSYLRKDKETTSEAERPHIINPVMIPYNNIGIIRSMNGRLVVRAVRRHMARLSMANPIVLATVPNAGDYTGRLGDSLSIYYCVDDFTNWPGVDSSLVWDMEKRLIDRSNMVFASSDVLCREKKREGKTPIFLPHGVDYAHFQNISEDIPELIEGVPKPIIGFFGVISPWLDFDLIDFLIQSRPEWSFVFLGPSDVDLSQYRDAKNAYFPGKIPYGELPSYAGRFDVGIIPFKVNKLTESVNPLKMLEYMAMGLPVVSTEMPEVRKFADEVIVAESYPQFLQGIECSLRSDSAGKIEERKATSQRHSWGAVAETLSSYLERAE